ncbi:MAG: thiamine phosphate synthase [Hyphomonadaceae bacterium]|nr:thiamine phosphate synthase [Hyphomonadaceae bacterium]
MASFHLLAARAARLNREAGAPALPSLYFFTDPARIPNPCAVARKLPRGTAIVYRHFGAADRVRMARRLIAICRSRGLKLLIAADAELAARVGADGVHWPEQRLVPRSSEALMTASAHSAEAVGRAISAGADACVLSPIFPTASGSGHPPLGLFRASQIARAAGVPVIALGGINARRANLLAGRGFAGVAAVGALNA